MARFSQQMLAGLLNPAYQQELTSAARGLGQTPAIMGLQRQEREQKQKLADIYSTAMAPGTSSVQLFQAAQQLMEQGNTEEALSLLAQARELQETEKSNMALTGRKKAMATRAVSLGLPEVAANIRSATDEQTLNDIAKDLRKTELERLPSQTRSQRLARAKQVGITEKEFNALGLADATDDYYNDYVTGEKGKTEAWLNQSNEVVAVRFNESGKAWDATQNKFVEASDLGLVQPAPSVQKVIDASNKMIEAIADETIKDIVNQRDRARLAKEKLSVLDRQISRLEGGMPTGIAAEIEVGLIRVGQLLGMPYDPKLQNAQEYMMEVANLVKTEIKAFGSGTSITDADREYTQRMVGGDIKQQAEALESMLNIYREAALGTINTYNDVIKSTTGKLGSENMGTFQQITLPEVGLSAAAQKYLVTEE